MATPIWKAGYRAGVEGWPNRGYGAALYEAGYAAGVGARRPRSLLERVRDAQRRRPAVGARTAAPVTRVGRRGAGGPAGPAPGDDAAALTARQRLVLEARREGRTLQSIAAELGVTRQAVEKVERAAQRKLGRGQSVALEGIGRAAESRVSAAQARAAGLRRVGEKIEQRMTAREARLSDLADALLAAAGALAV